MLYQRIRKASIGNHWICACVCPVCGNFFTALENNIKRPNTTSCGCVARKCRAENTRTHGTKCVTKKQKKICKIDWSEHG